MTDYINVGKNKEKVDAFALATGEPLFTDDFFLKDPLHIAFLYSPHAHARIRSIDTSEAESTPGVALVLTYKNTPRYFIHRPVSPILNCRLTICTCLMKR